MSRDLNKWLGIGRLGKDPEIRYLPDGKACANFSIACSDSYKDKSGNKVEKTEWVSISAFGPLAEVIGNYLRKGSKVFIEG
jgi:single-strand DNA-binding protein